MVRTRDGLKRILAQFINETVQRISVHKIILFGSYASGTPKEWSDIDIAVISPEFAGMNYIDRIKLLLDCAHNIEYSNPIDIETFGYTPEEYAAADHFDFLGTIKETGKVVYG